MSGNYYDASSTAANTRINIPQFDTGGLLRAGQVLGESLNYLRDREVADYKTAEDKRRWDMQNARADAQEKRAAEEYERQIREKQVTNDALRAVVDPKGFQDAKMQGEQRALEESYKYMTPQEIEQTKSVYNPNDSRKQWLDSTIGATGVDVGKVYDTKSRQYEIAAKTPGTPEYIAAENAKMDLFKREQAISHGNRMAEIGAQSAGQIRYLQESQNAPKAFVNPKTGDVKIFRPSEMEKFPEYTTTPDVFGDKLRDIRERDEKAKEFAVKKAETENKYKTQLATNISNYDAGSKETILSGVTAANDIIREYNKTTDKPASLTNADVDSLVTKSKGLSLFGREDIDDEAFTRSLAGEISAKTGKSVDEILLRLKSIPQATKNADIKSSNYVD